MFRKSLLFIFIISIQNSLKAQEKPEFRGVWIATVTNIDWPKTATSGSENQQASFIKILDAHKRNGINAVIVQIRPASDAFYPSTLEPWSQWFTGAQGRPPQPFYDPLPFMIAETHKRGMEFHAWINPYRAVFNIKDVTVAPTHITRIHPEWFLTYGDKKYFDPGNPEGRKYVGYIVRDIASRYDIDAFHFDDYFYPYKIAGLEFPDKASFQKYGNGMNKNDWRRSNVDSIIYLISNTIKKINPKCQFGISPFGIWRNYDRDPERGSLTHAGTTNYDDLYADILLWLKSGWIDYVTPQLYWDRGSKVAPFETLVDWWNDHCYGKNCYIGIGIYRAGSNENWRNKNELPAQINKIRSATNIQGMSFFSSKTFEINPNGWSDSLRLNYFKNPAPLPIIRK